MMKEWREDEKSFLEYFFLSFPSVCLVSLLNPPQSHCKYLPLSPFEDGHIDAHAHIKYQNVYHQKGFFLLSWSTRKS